MMDSEAREVREALIAVLSTTASIGIDIDQLCHLSAEELACEDVREDVKPYVSGAIYQLAVCMNYVVDPS